MNARCSKKYAYDGIMSLNNISKKYFTILKAKQKSLDSNFKINIYSINKKSYNNQFANDLFLYKITHLKIRI